MVGEGVFRVFILAKGFVRGIWFKPVGARPEGGTYRDTPLCKIAVVGVEIPVAIPAVVFENIILNFGKALGVVFPDKSHRLHVLHGYINEGVGPDHMIH